MKMRMYSILDSKVASYSLPFYAQTDASAVRKFSDVVNDGSVANNDYFRHPEDFSLFFVGEFDDSVGSLDVVVPQALVSAVSVKQLFVDKSAMN